VQVSASLHRLRNQLRVAGVFTVNQSEPLIWSKPWLGALPAHVARDLGMNEGTLGNWVARDAAGREGRDGLSTDDIAELKRLRAENAEVPTRPTTILIQ
jgi:hypothetical protein